MREKLIELIYNFHLDTNNYICDGCGSRYAKKVCEEIADHLIANGVTIPVRCKDCKHYKLKKNINNKPAMFCMNQDALWYNTKPDMFCSFGERRTEK